MKFSVREYKRNMEEYPKN